MTKTLDLLFTSSSMLYLAAGWLFFTDLFSTFYIYPGSDDGQLVGLTIGVPTLLLLPLLLSAKRSNLKLAFFLKVAWIAWGFFIIKMSNGLFRAYDLSWLGGRITEAQFRQDAMIAFALNGLALPGFAFSLYLTIKRMSTEHGHKQLADSDDTEIAALGSFLAPPKGMTPLQWYSVLLFWPVFLGGRDTFASMIIYGTLTLTIWLSLLAPGRFGGMTGPSFWEVAGWLYLGFVMIGFVGQHVLKSRINKKYLKKEKEELQRQKVENDKKEREAKIDAQLSKINIANKDPLTSKKSDTDILDRLME